MKKTTIQSIEKLAAFAGFSTWQRKKKACTGKWRGQYDYSILFDGTIRYYVSTGMKYFEQNINQTITSIGNINDNREKYLDILQLQIEKDNALANAEGLHTVRLIDIGLETKNQMYLFSPFLLIEVNNTLIKFVETSLCDDLKFNKLEQWVERKLKSGIYTAGAVQQPDFIFGKVRFSSVEGLYRIPFE